MKVSIADLKKTIKWIEENSKDVMVEIQIPQNETMYVRCVDNYQMMVEITLSNEGRMLPKIRKEDFLK